jgi:hypothetical protein
MPLLPTRPPDYMEIIQYAIDTGYELLYTYLSTGMYSNDLRDEYYIFSGTLVDIIDFFQDGVEDDEFQESVIAQFLRDYATELDDIRDMVEDDEDGDASTVAEEAEEKEEEEDVTTTFLLDPIMLQ